eukprot:gene26875-4484_t
MSRESHLYSAKLSEQAERQVTALICCPGSNPGSAYLLPPPISDFASHAMHASRPLDWVELCQACTSTLDPLNSQQSEHLVPNYSYSLAVALCTTRRCVLDDETDCLAIAVSPRRCRGGVATVLSVAYKNLVGARRASWRILQSVEQSEVAKGNEKRVMLIQKYRAAVEKARRCICGQIPGPYWDNTWS